MVSTLSRSRDSRNPGSRARRSSTIVLKLRVTAISHLPPLIFRPKPLGPLDVRVLPLLRSAGEPDHQLVAVATKIEPIPGPPIDPLLLHASTHALDVREITKAEPLDCNRHF